MSKEFLKELQLVVEAINKRDFNQFEIFDDIFKENCISKILRYLLSTEENHSLGDKFITEILNEVKVYKKFPNLTPRKVLETNATFNKSTDKRRFIDLVVECYDDNLKRDNSPFFVLGIEVKKWDIERKSQISDYQAYLLKQYKCPSLIIFLTPHEKEALTVNNKSACKCIPLGFSRVQKVCDKIQLPNQDVSAFIKKFGEYMSNKIANKVDQNLASKINDLWMNHKNEMNTLVQYGKNVKSIRTFVYEDLIRALHRDNKIQSAHIEWHYPRNVAVPREYNLTINKLGDLISSKRKKPYTIYFMIFSSANTVESNNWIVSVAAWPHSQKYDKIAIKDGKDYKEMFKKESIDTWSPWTFFESSGPFSFDLSSSDSNPSSEFIISYIKDAIGRLKEFYSLKEL